MTNNNAYIEKLFNASDIFCSIGKNCDSRIYMKNVLNISKKGGYKTCPFDLCMTSLESLLKTISDNFKTFYTDLHLIQGKNAEVGIRPKTASEGNKLITNIHNLVFNHESPTNSHLFRDGTNDDFYFIRNNFLHLRELYNARIFNFNSYIINNKYITLICCDISYEKESDKLVNNFYNIKKVLTSFKTAYKNNCFKLIVIYDRDKIFNDNDSIFSITNKTMENVYGLSCTGYTKKRGFYLI